VKFNGDDNWTAWDMLANIFLNLEKLVLVILFACLIIFFVFNWNYFFLVFFVGPKF
jgi:hypothetical protein